MKQRPRIYYSASQRALIWERWRSGGPGEAIAGKASSAMGEVYAGLRRRPAFLAMPSIITAISVNRCTSTGRFGLLPMAATSRVRSNALPHRTAALRCGFNRSKQQIDETVQPVFRSLVFSAGVR